MHGRRFAHERLALGLLAFAALSQAKGQDAGKGGTYRNPVLYADYSDPDVIRSGDAFYLVVSSFSFSPGLPILKSGDLVHWTQIGHVVSRLKFAPEYDLPGPVPFSEADGPPKKISGGQRYGAGIWAPAIRVHDGRFYVYWPTPGEGIFMASAEHPEGPWTEPVAVVPGPGYEDPCPFWDDDGKAYLIHSRVGAGPLILHRMAPDGRSVLDAGTVVVDDKSALPVLEGPKLLKRNGWYYIFAPYGGVPTGSQAVLRAKSPYGPYERRTVLVSGTSGVPGPHQGGYMEGPDGRGWFLHFSSHGAFGRIDYLEPVRWIDDWPVMGEKGSAETPGQPVASAPLPAEGPGFSAVRLLASDDFAGSNLGLQWEWNHNPVDSAWSLTEHPGRLRLRAMPAHSLIDARNTLTQILIGPSSHYEVQMDLEGMSDGQRAGLALFGMRPSWVGVEKVGASVRVIQSAAGVETPGGIWSEPSIVLTADVSSDETVRYGYAKVGTSPITPLGAAASMRFSWWKGSRPAIFTYTRGGAAGGYVDFGAFRYRPGP